MKLNHTLFLLAKDTDFFNMSNFDKVFLQILKFSWRILYILTKKRQKMLLVS